MSHEDIWGIQVEETVSAKALRVPGGCQEQGGEVESGGEFRAERPRVPLGDSGFYYPGIWKPSKALGRSELIRL